METFTEAEWQTRSLCEGWRVRDVAAHLTLAQTSSAAKGWAVPSARVAASTG